MSDIAKQLGITKGALYKHYIGKQEINFRKMLTLEQYRDPKLKQLYHDYLATGPTEYMAAISES